MKFEVLSLGVERVIYVYDSSEAFRAWCEGLERPPLKVLMRVIKLVADLPFASLMANSQIFKPLAGTKPKLFEIKRDQARLYCCLHKGDIVILAWEQKKQIRATPEVLKRAQRLAEGLEK